MEVILNTHYEEGILQWRLGGTNKLSETLRVKFMVFFNISVSEKFYIFLLVALIFFYFLNTVFFVIV